MSEESDRSLVGLLYTDIVGSTFHAARLGDRAWRDLLDRHDRLVREAIRKHGGREITTTGDGFVVVFDRPAQALRCAWDIRKRLSEQDLQVRSGVHAGVVEGRGDDIAGLVVHTGARIAAEAEPDEILVSRTVTEIEAGSGYEFEDRGDHALRGVPGEWRLFALRAVPREAARAGRSRWHRGALARFRGRRPMWLAGGATLIAIGAGLIWLARDGPGPDYRDPTIPTSPAPGIAVMPFTIQGEDIESWEEGLVTLLSTNLDGAGDLRAIDSRTVLAQWDLAVPGSLERDVATVRDVARRTGADFAIVGSATAREGRVRVHAAVYETATGEQLGVSAHEGHADSLFVLVDAITRDILETLVERGRGAVPSVDLASLTTSSIPALKAFMDGEIDYRGSRFDDALKSYERAIESDSLFAMAWYRIAQTLGWTEGASPRVMEALERSAALSDRLPDRDAAIVTIDLSRHRGYTDELPTLREVTRAYPDDAEAHFLLGEMLYHLPHALGTVEEMMSAFRHAVELDPTFTPYRAHLAEIAMQTNDPQEAASELAAYDELAPATPYARGGRLALTLISEATTPDQRRAIIDTSDMTTLRRAETYLVHPRFWEVRREVRQQLESLGHRRPEFLFWNDLYQRGHLALALESVPERSGPRWFPTCTLRMAWSIGIPVPEDVLERYLTITEEDTTPSPRTACGATYAADRGEWHTYDRALAIHRGFVERLRAEGDSVATRFEAAVLDAMTGYGEWLRGDPQGAEERFRRALRSNPNTEQYAFWLARLLVEEGRPAEAIPYFRSLRRNPLADLYRAEAHEAAGEPREAADAYRSLLDHWTDPDPELRFFVDRARAGLSRVTDTTDR